MGLYKQAYYMFKVAEEMPQNQLQQASPWYKRLFSRFRNWMTTRKNTNPTSAKSDTMLSARKALLDDNSWGK
jgi:hypothetical protein